MATKTQTTSEPSDISGQLGVYNQDQSPGGISAATKSISLVCGPGVCVITDVSTGGYIGDPPSPPYNNIFVFQVYLARTPYFFASEYVYFNDDTPTPWDIERSFSAWATGKRLWREESTSYGPGRDGKPVFADDVAYADAWVYEDKIAWSITFGGWTYSGGPELLKPFGPRPIDALSVVFDQHKGTSWLKYASAENLQWSAVNVNLAGMSKLYGAAPPGGLGTKVTGGVGSLELTCNDNPPATTSTWTHGLPLIPDFTRTSVRDRDGSLLNAVRLSGPFRASLEVPDSLNWSITP